MVKCLNLLQILRATMHPNFSAGGDAEPTVAFFKHFNELIHDEITNDLVFLAWTNADVLGGYNHSRRKQRTDFSATLSHTAH